jgi:hypothetical protein
MTEDNSPRRIAERIVASFDHPTCLTDSIGKSALPPPWLYGPAMEVRLRCSPRLSEIDEPELARRLDALGISGPLRRERLVGVALRLALQPGDLAVGQPWRPRGFGLWRLDDGAGLGVKVYASSRAAVDLLLAVPPRFLDAYGISHRFPYAVPNLADHPGELQGLARLCSALLATLRRAQPVARVEAAQVQDQSWCEPFPADARGLVIPDAVCAACGWASRRASRDCWAIVPLD